MSTVERRNVWELHRKEEWHPTILWYAKAVGALQAVTNLSDPRSWLHLANIHGTDTPRQQWPAGFTDRTWNACQHGSWYFLPWHRIYLHHFEKIVRKTIVDLQGPADWALPFWNYDPADPETLGLPPEFTDRTGKDGKPNPLFRAGRLAAINQGGRVPASDVELTVRGPNGQRRPWTRRFSSPSTVVPTFGGVQTGWEHEGLANGQLENEPHGMVHNDVGGVTPPFGLMTRFETAAQDPVFWMHHSNVDRLWEVWRNAANDDPLPTSSNWLGARFTFGSGTSLTRLTVGEVLRTTDAPLEYRYTDVPVPVTPVAGPMLAEADDAVGAPEAAADEVPPELVGSVDGVALGASPHEVTIETAAPQAPSLAEAEDGTDEAPTYLALENVTATEPGTHRYTVHVALPAGADRGDHPEREVGRFSTFGVVEATRRDDEHSGAGLTYSFDITPVVAELQAAGEWDPDRLTVTVTPDSGDGGDLQIGRIGVYRG